MLHRLYHSLNRPYTLALTNNSSSLHCFVKTLYHLIFDAVRCFCSLLEAATFHHKCTQIITTSDHETTKNRTTYIVSAQTTSTRYRSLLHFDTISSFTAKLCVVAICCVRGSPCWFGGVFYGEFEFLFHLWRSLLFVVVVGSTFLAGCVWCVYKGVKQIAPFGP